MINRDPTILHQTFRGRLLGLNAALEKEKIPLAMYEGWRSPVRQAYLYAQGRMAGYGVIHRYVTRSQAWLSFHQYGMAADFVFWNAVTGRWSWDEPAVGMWMRYGELATQHDLRCLSFERPHVEMPMAVEKLHAGEYPPNGGATWEDNLREAILGWGSKPRTASGIRNPGAPPWRGPIPIEARPPLL